MGFGGFLTDVGKGVGTNLLSGLITQQLTGGGAQSYPTPVQLPDQSGAAESVLTGIGNLDTGYSATLPMDLAYLNSVADNPYAPSMLTGANNASFAANTGGAAALDAGMTGYGAANRVLQTGFDPQNDLYNRLFNQNREQTLATEEAQGVGSTPYGAGITAQAGSNFNMDWQNQLLQRQLAAMGGFDTGTAAAGRNVAGAGDLFNTAGMLPYQAYGSINNDNLAALQAYQAALTGATAIPQQQITDLLQYLGQGASNANIGANAASLQNDQQQKAAAGLYPLVNQGVNAGFNYFNSPSYNAPQASFSGDYAQPVAPTNMNLPDQQLPNIPY